MTDTQKATVASIYTTLEMLVKDREDLHAWWCNLLYMANGEPNYPAWNDLTLRSIENDVIFNT